MPDTLLDTVPLFPVYQYIIKFGFATIWVHERPQLLKLFWKRVF